LKTTLPPASRTLWTRKDLLGLDELSADEISLLLETAKAFKGVGERSLKKVPALRGRTLINFFVEPSTRTRVSFELAAMRLSADVINVAATASSLQKGETLKDTAKNLEALHADIIVLRHSSAGACHFLAQRLDSCIVNAGDGAHEHPTQGLLDVFTMLEHLGTLAGKRVGIVGDILFSRVARSNIHALRKLGAEVILVGPTTLVPKCFEGMGVTVSHRLDEVLEELDVINLLRIQHERQRKEYFPGLGEYTALFGLTAARAERLKPSCLVMHPGPINRGVEIDSAVADSGRSVILKQVTNGLAVRMATLYLCNAAAVSTPANSNNKSGTES
jgi:aspartate carbamoyltransferase catalytic subunit